MQVSPVPKPPNFYQVTTLQAKSMSLRTQGMKIPGWKEPTCDPLFPWQDRIHSYGKSAS